MAHTSAASQSFGPDLLRLLTPLDAASVSDASRATALAFVRGARGWRKPDLLHWLHRSYAAITRHAPIDGRHVRVATVLGDATENAVRSLVLSAHREVGQRVAQLADKRFAESFCLTMLSFGFIARFEDSVGAEGWIPTNRPRRLVDRVSSLIAADLLARPVDRDGAGSFPRHLAAIDAYIREGA